MPIAKYTVLILLFGLSATPVFSKQVQIGEWVYSESRDDFTDKTNATAITMLESKRAILVSCNGGESLSIQFQPAQFIIGGAHSMSDMRYRIDKNPPRTTPVYIKDSWALLIALPDNKEDPVYQTQRDDRINAAEWLRQMMNGSTTIVMNVEGAQARFSLDGASIAIKKVTDQCPFIFQK